MEYIKVKDHSDLVRDPQTQSIINTNRSAYDEYISRRDANNEADQKSKSMEEDLANLKGEIGEIKDLLHQLVQSKYQ
jgi:hypothetical protein|tara:strand:- start:1746 stop:1976 length:231 start_codon:yes stop_codon:yes gene_type:complete